MNKTIFKSSSMRSVAIHNLFNRTSIFEPVQDRILNNNRSYTFKDSLFEVQIFGNYLNHSTDYPLFAMLIRHWRNAKANNEDPQLLNLPLKEVKDLLLQANKGTRAVDFKKIKASLQRLDTNRVSYRLNSKAQNKVFETGYFFEESPVLDFESKEIRFSISEFIEELYMPNSNISYLNIEELCNIEREANKALYKYLSTHGTVMIDFKLEKLSCVLGLKYRGYSEARCREYIVKSLKELQVLGIVRAYKWRKESNDYRILQSKYFTAKEAEFAIKHAKSNFKFSRI
ncbi:hypothetical protein EXT47_05200 [Pseudoalteromonas sp. CO342X]|uniref:replication initiator protein A n=1 Tax=Pseudoalteromonas sp. CO342X TaxID=1777270 RepID=UPI001022D027|nr:replication initiator protein A [Pseudoalteromonas sp. CO342X]RZG16725.1 hypothetical protein EXT47_05200 [Pseudoalteromonas sp. CO342X]